MLVPVKRLDRAKTRLRPALGEHHADVVRAMVLDTLGAARDCVDGEPYVVGSDPEVVALAESMQLQVISDAGRGDLNAALTAALPTVPGGMPVAVLPADLPALTSEDLALALRRAVEHDFAYLPDTAGSGTTLLAAQSRAKLTLAFGPSSAAAHETAGAHQLDVRGLDRLRADVDTLADLHAAIRLGVGEHTHAALARFGMI